MLIHCHYTLKNSTKALAVDVKTRNYFKLGILHTAEVLRGLGS